MSQATCRADDNAVTYPSTTSVHHPLLLGMQATMNRAFSCAALLSTVLFVDSCASPTRVVAPVLPSEVGEFRHGLLNGYIAPALLPDSLALLPAPPAAGSAAQAADDAAFYELTRFQGTSRGTIAIQDADLSFPNAAKTFSCALGVPISAEQTPNLNMPLRRTLTDAGLATYKAKDRYKRVRPFVVFKTRTCTPGEDAHLATDGSYPSGHTSVGWVWALTLAEIEPERADAILRRGRAFGQSRGICGAHWKSDIESGMDIGAATFSGLHASSAYVAQMGAARAEVEAERRRHEVPHADCAAEAAALAISSSLPP